MTPEEQIKYLTNVNKDLIHQVETLTAELQVSKIMRARNAVRCSKCHVLHVFKHIKEDFIKEWKEALKHLPWKQGAEDGENN